MIFQDCLGIDIVNGIVSVVYVRSSLKGVQIVARDSWPFGQDDRPSIIAENINRFLSENGAEPVEIYLGIPSDGLMIKEVTFPAAVRENLRDTLRYEMEKLLPVNLDDIVYDYIIKDTVSGIMNITLVVIKKKTIDFYMEIAGFIKSGITALTVTSFVINDFVRVNHCKNVDSGILAVRNAGDVHEFSFVSDKISAAGVFMTDSVLVESLPSHVRGVIESRMSGDSLNVVECFSGIASKKIDFKGLSEYYLPADFSLSGIESSTDIGAFALSGLITSKNQILNFLPVSARRKKDLTPYKFLVFTSAVFLLSLAFYFGAVIYKKNSAFRYYEKELSSLKEQAAMVEKKMAEAEEMEKKYSDLKLIFGWKPSLIEIHKEITNILPPDSWLKQFSVKADAVEIQGLSASSTGILPLLENSPYFKEVKFLSPITKDKDGNDLFRIGLKIEENIETGPAK